jgi:hypothetical protein
MCSTDAVLTHIGFDLYNRNIHPTLHGFVRRKGSVEVYPYDQDAKYLRGDIIMHNGEYFVADDNNKLHPHESEDAKTMLFERFSTDNVALTWLSSKLDPYNYMPLRIKFNYDPQRFLECATSFARQYSGYLAVYYNAFGSDTYHTFYVDRCTLDYNDHTKMYKFKPNVNLAISRAPQQSYFVTQY